MKPRITLITLGVDDLQRAVRFYRDGLGFEPVGEPAGDGVPEPLQFTLNDGLRVMLVPTGGFDRITGDHDTAPNGCSECVLTVATNTDEGVQQLIHFVELPGPGSNQEQPATGKERPALARFGEKLRPHLFGITGPAQTQ